MITEIYAAPCYIGGVTWSLAFYCTQPQKHVMLVVNSKLLTMWQSHHAYEVAVSEQETPGFVTYTEGG